MAKRPKKVPAESGYQGPLRKSVPAAAHQPPGFPPTDPGLFQVRWTRFDFNGPWCLGKSDSDETNISRLRINGEQRLYGFRRDPKFYVVFWDPEHKIWPSTLKHT